MSHGMVNEYDDPNGRHYGAFDDLLPTVSPLNIGGPYRILNAWLFDPDVRYRAPLELEQKEQQIGAILMKDDVPFTDSGYKSIPHPEHSMNVLPVLEKLTFPPSDPSRPQTNDRGNYDTKTLYSIGSTVNQGHAQNYVMELSRDIYSKLHRSIDTRDITVLSKILPELVKAFAIKLCHDAPDPLSRKVMHFVHKRHQ